VWGQAYQKIDSLNQVLATNPQHDTTRINLLNQLGFEYWTIDPSQSERYGREALKLSSGLNFLTGSAMAYRVIGVSYWSRGEFYPALVHLFKSQQAYKDLNDLLGEGNSTMNIGLVYADQKDYGRALEHFLRANQLFEKLNREDRIGITYNKIGSVYLEKGELDKASRYLFNGMEIHRKNDFHFGIMEAGNRIGLYYREKGELKEAERYLEQSLAIAQQNKDQEHMAKNLENLASIYIIRGELNKAESYLDNALPIAQNNQYKKWVRDIYKDYRDIHVLRKNFNRAFYYSEKYEAIKDSIFSEEKAAQIANLELEHQTAEQQQALKLKEKEILLLQQQARFDRLVKVFLISGAILMLVIVYIVFYNQRYRHKKNQELLERSRELAEKKLENARLKEIDLQHALEFKNKELTSYTVNFIRKNELIETLRDKLLSLKNSIPDPPRELNALLNLVQQNTSIDKDWDDFKRTFENVHQHFFGKMLALYPDLTQSELKLSALICLNLSVKEMASLMGISPDSVKTARYRLRKKLGLEPDQSLVDFIIRFSHQQA
jgi:DNA-binding CsgD family transcriptional regulator/cell division protein FtsL